MLAMAWILPKNTIMYYVHFIL